MNFRTEKLGELESLVVPGQPGGPGIILCHGYGANAFDLLPLAEQIKAEPGTHWFFPQAPLTFSLGPQMEGRAWFPLVARMLERLLAAGENITYSEVVPDGLAEAREKLSSLVTATNIPLHKLTLGGFSQGSMLTTDFTLRCGQKPAGLIILSGTLICEHEWRPLVPALSGLEFFQAHGTEDPILPYSNARRLEELLRSGGLIGEFLAFAGGHAIPPAVQKKLSAYLRRNV
ncbi:MAG: esterase [Spirochaetales bacterium]|nr:esterase [Spirochaetales bacterium]